ncbi:MAG: autotransporter outer membrane beta-barrel domain-containing protein [Gammaproteobacteria bacterium]|nr:autotransporter outer membrane beta-barrel domain-containing protein [Gammaproteobacteria bacterium]
MAEQALDGVSVRIEASREPGWRGSLGGIPLGGGLQRGDETGAVNGPDGFADGLSRSGGIADEPFGQRPGGFGRGALSGHGAAPGHGTPGGYGTPGACGATGGVEPGGVGTGAVAPGVGPQPAAPPARPDPSCAGQGSHGLAALTGTDFSVTGKPDAGGGTLAFWGRGARTAFGGRDGPVSIDGEVSTGLLGADYANDGWLVGLALAHSLGDGAFADPQVGSGEVASSLTAAIPYASLEASERLSLWGAAGYGAGEVALEGGGLPAFAAGIDWAMTAAGARGGLFAPSSERGGPALDFVADALWSRTGSEKTSEMVATASDVTRLRVGLEGSWSFKSPGGGELKPRLETGLRHDGGDAETGFGVELGGGLVWTDPRLGLSLDIAARTLLAHEAEGRTERGLSAAIAFDPDPSSSRGLSLSLKQDLGGTATGGLDALFAHEPLGRHGAFGGDAGRWTAEAAWGLPAFRERFTGTPHFGYGRSGTGRDYRLGWRLEPASPDARQLTFGIELTRREDAAGAQAPDHAVNLEVRARW